MKRIEFRDLVIMGASDRVLDFYSNTDPFSIHMEDNNVYHIGGCLGDGTVYGDDELMKTLESWADEFSN